MSNIRSQPKRMRYSTARRLGAVVVASTVVGCLLFLETNAFYIRPQLLGNRCKVSSPLYSSITASNTDTAISDSDRVEDMTSKLAVPLSLEDMISMASKAISDASNAGISRQIVRMLLPRNPSSQLLGQFYEMDATTNNNWRPSLLVPPDETWQGGIMQLYRAALPTCTHLLR